MADAESLLKAVVVWRFRRPPLLLTVVKHGSMAFNREVCVRSTEDEHQGGLRKLIKK
jgi:hypothetical protein